MKGDYIMAGERKIKLFEIPNANLIFRNFSGRTDIFGNSKRTFGVKIENEELLNKLMDAGFLIKYLNNGDDPDIPWLKCTVKFGDYPPKVWIKSGKEKTRLTEDTIGILDSADIIDVKLTISPYEWELPTGKKGVTAYVNALYVTVAVDKFAEEFFDDDEDIPFD